jgi:hypothetical protein
LETFDRKVCVEGSTPYVVLKGMILRSIGGVGGGDGSDGEASSSGGLS